MSRKVTSRKTPEQRRAQAEALQASIADQVEAFRDSDQWRQFLEFAQAFHAYSPNNVLLILAQKPAASQVAGFRKWQELGRQVRKGEKAIKIFGFSKKKIRGEDDNGDETEREITIYPILSVFDIGQTDLIDPDAADPSAVAQPLTGDDPQGIAAAAAAYLTAQGWTVTHEHIDGPANGYTRPEDRKIVIDADLTPAHTAKTTLHEAAHAILHEDLAPADYIEHRGRAETEAESVAYVVAGICGLDTSAYTIGYVAGWSNGNTDLIRETAAAVLKTAHTIADNITADDEADAAA